MKQHVAKGDSTMMSKATESALRDLYRAVHDESHGSMDFTDCVVCDKLDDVITPLLGLVEVLLDEGD